MRKKAFGETPENIEGSRDDEEQPLESEPVEAEVEQGQPGHAMSPPVEADATTEPVVIETAPSESTKLKINLMSHIVTRLGRATPIPDGYKIADLLHGSVGFYRMLAPRSAAESMLAEVIVATFNSTMEDYAQAALCGSSHRARILNATNGYRGTDILNRLLERYQAMQAKSENSDAEGKPENVMVGHVTVEPGGQAIVGRVTMPRRKPGNKMGRKKRKE